jgi:hypothetical protein
MFAFLNLSAWTHINVYLGMCVCIVYGYKVYGESMKRHISSESRCSTIAVLETLSITPYTG